MIKAIIFDLDNCLSAADEVGRDLYEPAFAAIRAADRGTLANEELQTAFDECWRLPLDFIAVKHGFSKEMLAAGWEIFARMEFMGVLRGYPDLAVLEEIEAMKFLVTSGFRRLQESKVRALGFSRLFATVCVDAIDEPGRKGKQGIFAEILETYHLSPGEVLVVGDNADSEIKAGNRLGIQTVQILRPGVPRGGNATHYIEGLAEVKKLLTANSAHAGSGNPS